MRPNRIGPRTRVQTQPVHRRKVRGEPVRTVDQQIPGRLIHPSVPAIVTVVLTSAVSAMLVVVGVVIVVAYDLIRGYLVTCPTAPVLNQEPV